MLILLQLRACGQRRSAVHQIQPKCGGRRWIGRRRVSRGSSCMKTGAAGLVCRRCGISRATLRKWWRRYQADGEAGLVEHSRRPHRLAARGREFLAEAVQQRLMDWAIKFRPIPLRSPHLNGKVERTHRADREEFWDTVDPKDPEIEAKLSWLSAGGE
jgi:transposase-like protein